MKNYQKAAETQLKVYKWFYDQDLFYVHNLAESIARGIISDKSFVCPLTAEICGEEVTWTISRSNEKDNTVVFSCNNGKTFEFDYENEASLASDICDILVEL